MTATPDGHPWPANTFFLENLNKTDYVFTKFISTIFTKLLDSIFPFYDYF